MYLNINGAGLLLQLLAFSGLLALGLKLFRLKQRRAILVRIRREDDYSVDKLGRFRSG